MEPVFERYSPQHPLPEDIQNLPRNDTVCHYCGVSYLIHREIKILEEKIQQMEEELEKYHGCEQRESELLIHVGDLQSSNGRLENQNKDLQKTSTSLTAQLEVRTEELEVARQHLKNLEGDILDLNQEVSALTKENETQRGKNSNLQSKMVSIFNSLKQEKEEISNISSVVEQNKVQFNFMFKEFYNHMKQLNMAHQMDIQRLKMTLVEMEREKDEIMNDKNKKIEIVKEKEELVQQMNSLQTETKNLKTKLKHDEERIEELKQKLTKSEDDCRYTNSESNQYKEQVKNMKQIVEDLNAQLRKKEGNMENLLQKSQMESHDLQQKLQAVRREHKNAQNQLLVRQTNENEIQRKQDLSLALIEQLKESEHKLLKELESVKQEREKATIAHHQQIEDLKESFRQKTDYEQWPLKLETALQQERNNHNKEKQELKEKLTENFFMDLEIEKQKYQKLVDKYHEDSQIAEDKLKEQVKNAVKCHVDAIKDLEELLKTTRSSCAEREDSLKKEVDGLKQVIKDLETQLCQIGTVGQDELTQLGTQLKSSQLEVTSLKDQQQTIHQQLEKARIQVVSLQDTVRKECEERLELTESLTAARIELLQLKKPAGGYNKVVSKSPISQQSSTNKLAAILDQGEGNNTDSKPPTTSLSDSVLTNTKSVDQPKLNPLNPVGTGHRGSVPTLRESTRDNKETKPVKGFLTEQRSIFHRRHISDDRRRFLALLTRNSNKISN